MALGILKEEDCIECTLEEAWDFMQHYDIHDIRMVAQGYDKIQFNGAWMGDDVVVITFIVKGRIICQCFNDTFKNQHWFANRRMYSFFEM